MSIISFSSWSGGEHQPDELVPEDASASSHAAQVQPSCTPSSKPLLHLSEEDHEQLNEFNRRLDVIEDYVNGVCLGHHTGFYLSGRGGTGKSQRVKEVLEQQEVASWVVKKAKMTPTGLWELLEAHPNSVIVLDDVTALFSKAEAKGIFLAALDGNPAEARSIDATIHRAARTTHFSGGIIAISNLPLADDPVGKAISSRFIRIDHNPTDGMLTAAMRNAALHGYEDDRGFELLNREQCWEVTNFLIEECRASNIRIDLRFLKKAWNTYRQWWLEQTKLHWRELVRASLQRPIGNSTVSERRRREIEQEEAAIAVHRKLTAERTLGDKRAATEAWQKFFPPDAPGHSVDRYYAILKRLRSRGGLP